MSGRRERNLGSTELPPAEKEQRTLLRFLPQNLNLKIELAPVARLAPYAQNARTHSKKQIAQIGASYRQFGVVSPVLLADDDTIIAGHGRVLAAKELGLVEIPAIRLHPDTRRATGLSDR